MAFTSLTPTSDTKAQVVLVYDDQPIYICSKCSAVIVRIYSQPLYLILLISLQALQDEVISKAFSGRDGRG
jgi:hypothetical protein